MDNNNIIYYNNNNQSTNGASEMKDIERNHQPNNCCRDIKDYSRDFAYSLTLIILGTFLWIPFFLNIVYIRSPNKHARRMAFASLILGSLYFIGFFVPFTALILYYVTEHSDYSYYYDRYNGQYNRY